MLWLSLVLCCRLVAAASALRVAAFTSGRGEVALEDGLLLAYMLNNAPACGLDLGVGSGGRGGKSVADQSDDIIEWWLAGMRRPPATAEQALVETAAALGESWEALTMASEAASFSPHLADSLLEAHVRPVLLPALSDGASVLEQELLRLRQASALMDMETDGAGQQRQHHTCIWLSDELNAEMDQRRKYAADEVKELLEAATLEMLMLSDVRASPQRFL